MLLHFKVLTLVGINQHNFYRNTSAVSADLYKVFYKKGRDLWAHQIKCFMHQILILIAPNIYLEKAPN